MLLQVSFLVTIFTLCFGLREATLTLEDGIRNAFLAKYRLLQSPKKAITAFCKTETNKTKYFNCVVKYEWRNNNVFQSDCTNAPTSFGPRYYHIILECNLGETPVKGLRSEWRVKY